MSRNRNRVPGWLVALGAVGGLTGWCWWDSRWMDWWPVQDAAHEARKAAAAEGYRMEGSYGDFISQPDAWGGCEVRFEFYDLNDEARTRKVTVDLRRTWRLAGWEVTGMTVETTR